MKKRKTPEHHNMVRLYILKVLNQDHPDLVDCVLLRRVLATWGYPVDEYELDSYLAYLQERGYVRREERKGFDIEMAAITSNGIDVLDGRIKDRGVGVD